MASNEPGFSLDKLLTTQDLLPRQQLLNALRGGISDAQEIEQKIYQTFAYQVGFQPATTANGLIVPTLLSANPDGSQNVWVLNSTYSAIGIQLPFTVTQYQAATHAANIYTVSGFSPLYTVIFSLTVSVSGSGTMPTVSAPINWSVVDGSATLAAGEITQGGGQQTLIPALDTGLWSFDSGDVVITIADGGANVKTEFNMVYNSLGLTANQPYVPPS